MSGSDGCTRVATVPFTQTICVVLAKTRPRYHLRDNADFDRFALRTTSLFCMLVWRCRLGGSSAMSNICAS